MHISQRELLGFLPGLTGATEMDRLRFGTAGIPISTLPHDTAEGVKRVHALGLECMELEFVRSVNLTESSAKQVRAVAKAADVELTVHAPYFINLNSLEDKKREDSIGRILKSARVGALAGAKSVTFHAAFYMGQEKEKVYAAVRDNIKRIVDTLREENSKVMIRPELTGKETQLGNLQELVRISQDIEGVLPCIDFAHYFARYNGKHNSFDDFSRLLEEIEKGLGRRALDDMHIHMSGIEYGEKGERMHLVLEESKFNYKAVLEALHGFDVKGVVICESPIIEEDALLMKQVYEKF
jgi:deoxyribonuclease-4